MIAEDLPLLRHWLGEPHVVQWWGKPEEQFDLVSNDLDRPAMEQFIVSREGRAFGYLQCYNPDAWEGGGLGPQPAGTRGIDQFIGEADMLNAGHGSGFIRSFIEQLLLAGTPRVITDPGPANARAIHAYERAGFQKHRLIDTYDGRALLMVRDA